MCFCRQFATSVALFKVLVWFMCTGSSHQLLMFCSVFAAIETEPDDSFSLACRISLSLSLSVLCLDIQHNNAVQGHFIAQWDYHRHHQHFCTLCSPVPFETSSFYGRRWTDLSRLNPPFVWWKGTEQFENWAILIYSNTKTYWKKHYNLISVFLDSFKNLCCVKKKICF